MNSFGIPAKLIRLVKMTITNFTCQIRVDGKLSGSFARGWRLWEPSSISQPRSWHTLRGLRRSYVAEAYQGIEQVVESLGLQINEAKTKLMVAKIAGLPINNQNLRRRDVRIGERTFEVVPQFTYIGSKVRNDNCMEAELRARMLAANRSFYSLKIQFTSKNLSRRTKLGLYSTCIVLKLTYASETLFNINHINNNSQMSLKLHHNRFKTDQWRVISSSNLKLPQAN